jgi:hypothetical protein
VFVPHDLTLTGGGADVTLLDAEFLGRHFVVDNVHFTLKGVSCINGQVGPIPISDGVIVLPSCDQCCVGNFVA